MFSYADVLFQKVIKGNSVEKEQGIVMGPMISVCRKGDSVYLTLEGSFNTNSFHEMLQALKRMVMSTLEFSPPDSKVAFTFKTHGKVNLEKKTDPNLSAPFCNC